RIPATTSQRVETVGVVTSHLSPRERKLEDPLAQVAGEEQPAGAAAAERGEKSELGHAHVLGLVHHDEVVRKPLAGHDLASNPAVAIGVRQQTSLVQRRPNPLEYRPQRLASARRPPLRPPPTTEP